MGSKPSVARKDQGMMTPAASSAPVEFYWDPVSPPSRCVHMTLKGLGEKFIEKKIDLFKGESKTPEFLKINPAGKVPAIKCGDFCLNESRAIACYLCNKYMTPTSNKLYPKNPEGRANVDRILLLSDEINNAIMKQINLLGVMFQGQRPDEDQMSEAAQGLKMTADILGDNRFVAGNNVTIADYFVATPFILYDMATDEGVQERFYEHEGGDKVTAWMERVRALPYYDEVHKDANEKLGGLYRSRLEQF